ncbi:hypothetical protein Rhopal_003328-T1 [Rhodotorula paludigena]|uniref:Uncharacterized protein n=1 Tax=Rhodotorula paludigena TaxID=86838 RepID=A0AAV5GM32_9BASI|nr:hypothetical protein Rhopal_003328-T1 [Rhodotorula paludigena]
MPGGRKTRSQTKAEKSRASSSPAGSKASTGRTDTQASGVAGPSTPKRKTTKIAKGPQVKPSASGIAGDSQPEEQTAPAALGFDGPVDLTFRYFRATAFVRDLDMGPLYRGQEWVYLRHPIGFGSEASEFTDADMSQPVGACPGLWLEGDSSGYQGIIYVYTRNAFAQAQQVRARWHKEHFDKLMTWPRRPSTGKSDPKGKGKVKAT